MRIPIDLPTLYLANSALLIAHEIDSAYWQEWNLFHLPGGIQVFVLLNLLVVVLVLAGYRSVLLGRRSAVAWSWLLVGGGGIGVVVHGWFLAAGDQAFRAPMSMLVLAAWGILSVLQAIVSVAASKPGGVSGPAERPREGVA
jgi:hypothetical protein